MVIDVLHQLLLLPVGEPTANARYKRRDTLVHAHELVCQCDTERLHVGALVFSTCALSLSAVSHRSRSKKQKRGRNSISAKRSSDCSNELCGSMWRNVLRGKARGIFQ